MLEVGDVVRLKSGGPSMTVDAKMADGQSVNCSWFDGAKPQTKNFSVGALEKIDPKKPRAIGIVSSRG